MSLKQLSIANAKPREKPYKLFDADGLYLLVQPNGSKLWRFKYRFLKKEKLLAIGAYPAVGLADARTKRDDARKLLAQGIDPSQKKQHDKVAAGIAAANTFGVIAKEYIEKLRAEGRAEITLEKKRWLLLDIASPLTNRPITEITPAEILTILNRLEKNGRRETAHRLRGTIGAVFRFAIATLRATTDPTYALRGALPQVQVTHRAAITDERELGALMVSIDEHDGWPTLRAALKFVVLTMARPGEVRHLKRPEVDRKRAVWTVPAERMKMRRPHDVPLSAQALSASVQAAATSTTMIATTTDLCRSAPSADTAARITTGSSRLARSKARHDTSATAIMAGKRPPNHDLNAWYHLALGYGLTVNEAVARSIAVLSVLHENHYMRYPQDFDGPVPGVHYVADDTVDWLLDACTRVINPK